MSDVSEVRGFLSAAKLDHVKLEKKLFATRKKIDEIQNMLHDNEALQTFLHEQLGEDE